MAGRIPKHPEERLRRNLPPKMTMLPEHPDVKTPRLPKTFDWTEAGKNYWKTIWASPMAAVFIDADLPALVRLTFLVELIAGGTVQAPILSEIRQLEDRFGLSPLARRRLQFEIDRANGGVTSNTEDGTEDDARWLRVVDSG